MLDSRNVRPWSRWAAVALSGISLASTLALAQGAATYPSKPIRIIVPFTTGSATDTLARTIGERLSAAWGQSVVVENRPGAGGTIGIAALAKSPADGYTLGVVSTGHVVNPVLYPNLGYDTLKDFAGVAALASLPSVLAVSPTLGVSTVKELVALALARPGQLNYGTAGVGSASHINSEKFRVAAGIDAVHVPFKGTPEMLSETMGGRIQYLWTPIISSLGPLRDRKLIPVAVSTKQRSSALPDVPTIAEAGFPAAEFVFWIALLAPAATPRDVIAKLNTEVNAGVQSGALRERLGKLGADPLVMSPEQLDSYIGEEFNTLGAVMRASAGRK